MDYRLFVYGTLRRGEINHGLLDASPCESLVAWVSGSLVDTGRGYPAITKGPGMVCGEIYRVDRDTLAHIDDLEDYYGPGDPRNLYERVETKALTDRGEVDVLVYVSDRFGTGSAIPYGEWKLYRMMRKRSLPYFAYGHCTDDARFKKALAEKWFGDAIGRGTVCGCNLQFTRHPPNGGRADKLETGGVTEGELYRMPADAMARYLDVREGSYAGICRPAVVPVTMDNGEVVDAVTFVIVEEQPDPAPPRIIPNICRDTGSCGS
ncbi:MAG TPA: gamma-glutamylcyclotransferase [Paenibacillaceae bacterium]